ncbi:hypothetical protein D3C72_2222490 [compost metagenome]
MLAYLPVLPEGALILALPTLTPDPVLLAQVRQSGCLLALRELGSQAPELLQAGWPIRYWLPAPSEFEALLQPLATRLALRRLGRAESVQNEVGVA